MRRLPRRRGRRAISCCEGAPSTWTSRSRVRFGPSPPSCRLWPPRRAGASRPATNGSERRSCEVRTGRGSTSPRPGKSSYPFPGALPVVSTGVSIREDLGRRDFTVHAMAFRLSDAGVEPTSPRPVRRRARTSSSDVSVCFTRGPWRTIRPGSSVRRATPRGSDSTSTRALPRRSVEVVESGSFARISGDRLRRALQEVLSEQNRGMAVEILARLGVFDVLVEGWNVPDDVARDLSETPGPEAAWVRLMAPASPSLRERIASRLNFSRALRRAVGCPR